MYIYPSILIHTYSKVNRVQWGGETIFFPHIHNIDFLNYYFWVPLM